MSQADLDLPILFIDDDAMVRSILAEYLRSFGFRNVLVCRDPHRALQIIRDRKIPIGLVLSDWEMPGLNGLTLLRALRMAPHRKSTHFIMITSQQSMERYRITQAAQQNVNAYLVKPFKSEVLKERIWQVMGWSEDDKKAS